MQLKGIFNNLHFTLFISPSFQQDPTMTLEGTVEADALRAWLVQLGRVPVRVLVGRVGKGTVPLRLEHVNK